MDEYSSYGSYDYNEEEEAAAVVASTNEHEYHREEAQPTDALHDIDTDLINEYRSEMGSFAYMPKNFAGMETDRLGFHIVGRKAPFIELKERIINDAAKMSIEDRMQGVRYLCSIPYNNKEAHCVEAAMSIIRDESVDIYARFYFFSSKDRYYRLDDHTVYYLYGGFLKQALRNKAVKVPYEIIFLTVEYILKNYSPDMASRQISLDFCLDIIENEYEDVGSKLKALRILLNTGDAEERAFARDQLMQQFEVDDINDIEMDDQDVSDLLRAIRMHVGATFVDSAQPTELFASCCKLHANDADILESLDIFFNDIVNGPIKYEGISISHILVLWYQEVCAQDAYTHDECIRQFVHIVSNPDIPEDDIIPSIIRVLSDFIQPVPFRLGPTIVERLRNDVFAGLNRSLMALNEGVRKDVVESRASEDKSAAKEFLVYFDDEKAELKRTYMAEITPDLFEQIFDKTCEEWMSG